MAKLSFNKLFKHGRFGNVCFQIAAVVSEAKRLGMQPVFPVFKYDQFLEKPLPHGDNSAAKVMQERHFHFHDLGIDSTVDTDLIGYYQSEKYFDKELVRDTLRFKPDFIQSVKNKMPSRTWERQNIIIQIRRGDYVGNDFYYQIPITYYISALTKFFPDWRDYNLVFFSDDLGYCRTHFGCLENAIFTDQLNDIEQVCMMSLCQPKGTRVKTSEGDVNIEDLKTGDHVLSHCDRDYHERVIGRGKERGMPPGRKIKSISKKEFNGQLVVASTSTKTSKYTPDHICIVKPGDCFKNKSVVYVMRKGRQFKVGVSHPTEYHNSRKIDVTGYSDVRRRFGAQGADDCWIVGTFDNKYDALLEESYISATFGIPEVQFNGYGCHKKLKENTDLFWKRIGDNYLKGVECLKSYGKEVLYPFYKKGERVVFTPLKRNEVRACNLISGMTVLDYDEYISKYNGKGKSDGCWVPIEVSKEDYNGDVYSMDVAINKTYFADGILTHNCDHAVIANSSFGWWGVWLMEHNDRPNRVPSKIIHCGHLHESKLREKNNPKDYYPERWIRYQLDDYRIDLSDVTFTIPVMYDHPDRKKNVDLGLCHLQKFVKAPIMIGECKSKSFEYTKEWVKYIHYPHTEFHRTKMLNDMANEATTPYVVNWDCDIFIPPMQIYLMAEALRSGKDMVYPYDGRFARMDRLPWFKRIESTIDIGMVGDEALYRRDIKESVGGAVAWNKDSFIDYGMENEYMVSYAPEDVERWERAHKLGAKIERIPGTLYHMNHYKGMDSHNGNPHFKHSKNLLESYRKMTPDQLRQEVDKWAWRHIYTPAYYERIHSESVNSAKEVAKVIGVFETVIDIGCGTGAWKELSNDIYVGVDHGKYGKHLSISEEMYSNINLEKADYIPTSRDYDLAICLEVAEHISEGRADWLIKELCTLSDTVLFSAAIPDQGGTGHVNEQFQTYWAEKFYANGFGAEICYPVKDNPEVEPWYRQNMILYKKGAKGKVYDFVLPEYYTQIIQHFKNQIAV